ncbi:DUF485 domain-containing protein [Tessaracoccus sp.]
MSTQDDSTPTWDNSESTLPPDHWPLPEVSVTAPLKHQPTPEEFSAVAVSPEFAELRHRFTSFAFPMTAAFLIWYFAYVLLSVFARDFMATPIIGNLNLGMILGLFQFATTFLITWLYIRHANKNLDPIATKIRSEMEAER